MWTGEIEVDIADATFRRLHAAPIARRSHARLYEEAWRVAKDLGWARTYDAEYVALARLLRLRLVTSDARLLRGAARVVEVISPADL